MSEQSIQAKWEENDDIGYHQGLMQEALLEMRNQVILPVDNRWQLAYSLLVSGIGQDSGVMSTGTFGTVKTTMGNLMLGPDQRISLNAHDTEEKLFGHDHPNPTNGSSPKFIPGKFKVVDPTNPTFFLNELPHMRNQKPVQQLWDGEELVFLNGERIDLKNAAFYITGNYPNGRDVFRLSPSILSRIAAEVLTGDVDDQTARLIQSSEGVEFDKAPLLPAADVRKVINELVTDAYPNPERTQGGNETGNFTVDLINSLNKSELVAPISSADARIGKAITAASRAFLFAHDKPKGTVIKPIDIARIAALVMPTVVELSATAVGYMSDSLRGPVPDLDKAIATRRIIARNAFRIAYERAIQDDESFDGTPGISTIKSEGQIELDIATRTGQYSYADTGVLGYDIDLALKSETEPDKPATAPRRRVLRGIPIRRHR
jgi:hypothetical protein